MLYFYVVFNLRLLFNQFKRIQNILSMSQLINFVQPVNQPYINSPNSLVHQKLLIKNLELHSSNNWQGNEYFEDINCLKALNFLLTKRFPHERVFKSKSHLEQLTTFFLIPSRWVGLKFKPSFRSRNSFVEILACSFPAWNLKANIWKFPKAKSPVR